MSQLDDNKKQPDIRFNGFSGDWELSEIGQIVDEKKRPVTLLDDETYQLVTVKRRNEGVTPRERLKGKEILVKNYKKVEANDFLISKRQIIHGACGIVPQPLNGAIVSNEYMVIGDSKKITSNFWNLLSKRPQMYKVFFISSFGVDIEKMVFSVSDWKDKTVNFPSPKEQTTIGNFFKQLDDSITLHKRKHRQTQQLKKAMLNKLFPQKGQTQPEIRLQGFSGDWVEKKLGDIAEFLKGQSLSKSDIKHRAENPCIHYGELFTDYGRCIDKVKSYTELEPKNSITSLENDILMPTSDVTPNGLAKASAIDFKNVILGGDIIIIRSDNILNKFFAYFVEGHQKEVIELVTGTTVFHIYGKDMAKFTISLPKDYAEQTAIGNFFKQLDDTLALQTQQINTLENLKKAFLQKMFV